MKNQNPVIRHLVTRAALVLLISNGCSSASDSANQSGKQGSGGKTSVAGGSSTGTGETTPSGGAVGSGGAVVSGGRSGSGGIAGAGGTTRTGEGGMATGASGGGPAGGGISGVGGHGTGGATAGTGGTGGRGDSGIAHADAGAEAGRNTDANANPNVVKTRDTPTIFYASDSTVRHYSKEQAEKSGQQGLGQRLLEFFTNEVSLENYARGGKAITSFKSEGLWGKILANAKPGDVTLIQFGINDRGDVPDVNVFKQNLRDYTKEARAIGLIPVFVTPTPRFQHENGVFTNAFTKYCDAKIEVGKELDVPVIDLQTKGREFFTEIGPTRVDKEMMMDTLHPLKDGAYHLARLVAEGISESVLSPLRDYVIKERLDPSSPQTTDGWSPRAGYAFH